MKLVALVTALALPVSVFADENAKCKREFLEHRIAALEAKIHALQVSTPKITACYLIARGVLDAVVYTSTGTTLVEAKGKVLQACTKDGKGLGCLKEESLVCDI